MTINAALTQLRVKPVPEEPEVTEETEPSSGTSETDKAGEGDSGKSSTGSGGSDGGGTDQSLSVSVPPSSLAPVSSSPASATAALPPHVLEGLQAVPCVAARRELLFKCRGVVREMEEGFDPSINVSDPRYLRALPTTSSNAEGQKLLMQILLAADTLIHSEGGNRASSTRLSVKIQTISNILLECFEQQDPRWQQ